MIRFVNDLEMVKLAINNEDYSDAIELINEIQQDIKFLNLLNSIQ